MESKINQETLYNPQQSREINTINLEHNTPLIEHTLGRSHATLSSNKSEAISDPGSITTTKLFTKPIVFAPNLEWSVDQVTGLNIYDNTLLNIFETLENSPGGQALRANAFFRSGAKVQLKVSTSPFHSGKLIFYYVPPGVNSTFRSRVYSKTMYPCVYVDAGDSTTAELDIPFVAIKDFFATQNPNSYSDFGSIIVSVFNPLAIGTGGQTTVNFALSLHPTENQIALPVYAHNIQLQAGLIPLLGEIAVDALSGATPAIASGIAGLAAGGVGASLIDGIATNEHDMMLTNAQNELDKINRNNTTSTKDLNISAPSLSNMANAGTEHLSLLPERTFVSHPSSHSPLDDEMNIQRIAQVPALIAQTEWSNTIEPSTVLLRIPINPMVVASTPTSGTATVYPTFLAHVSSPFAYWRGSIEYHFTFASTMQHKGKIIAAWVPFDSVKNEVSAIQPNPTVETLSLYPNEIFDLSLNKEFTFSVPYNTETPYRVVPADFNKLVEGSDISDDYTTTTTLGTLFVMVYNRLSNPSTVTSSIMMNTFIKAGKDYQLRALTYNNKPTDYHRINYVTLQGLEVAMESSRGGMLTSNQNRVGVVNATLSNTSFQDDDSEHDLQKLLSKYYPQVGLEFTLAAQTIRRVEISNLPGLTYRGPRVANETDPRWHNLINHYRDIFAFWNGSLNYFIIHNTTVNTPILLMISHDPENELDDNIGIPSEAPDTKNDVFAAVSSSVQATADVDLAETSIYSHLSNLRVNPTVEITPAYRSIYRRLYTTSNVLGANDPAELDAAAGSLDLVYSNPSTNDIPISALIFQSVGSDFRFKYLIPPPSLEIRP